MSWMFSIWAAGGLLALCGGQNTLHAGLSLSASGYHLCVWNKTRTVTFLAVHTVPVSVSQPCGGWLLWKTCTVTVYRMSHRTQYRTASEQETGCCHGYVQVGRYCTPYLNRSGELCAKPGACPAPGVSYPGSTGCEWDVDCPGWQKCCHGANHSLCSQPTRWPDECGRGGNRFNATVVVKTDYGQLLSKDGGLLNHTRLLQAMVAGALQSDVTTRYMGSWSAYPYRTATALLIDCGFDLSLHHVRSKLHLLLGRIDEVLSVTVEDIDECEVPTLHCCPPSAGCNNTLGSYQCICHQGYVDVDPSHPGASCKAEDSIQASTAIPFTSLPTINATSSWATTSLEHPQGSSSTGNSMTATPRPTGPTSHDSSQVLTASTPSSTTDSHLSTSACSSPGTFRLMSANVTGSSFSVYWSSQFQTNQISVVVKEGPKVLQDLQVRAMPDSMVVVRGLDPGVLYNVTAVWHGCGGQGSPVHMSVRTDALTLRATGRLTNVQFTADLQDSSSPAYQNLSGSIAAEIYRSLPPEVKAMWDSGQVRVEIRGFTPGSVVANLAIIFTPSHSQDIANVSAAILDSLTNTTKYTVDPHTNMTDFDECALGDNDCSPWATCTNTGASYACVCPEGFKDENPQRPGRACQAEGVTFSPPTSSTEIPTSDHLTYTKVTHVATATAEILTNNPASDHPTYTEVTNAAMVTAENSTDNPASDHPTNTEVTDVAMSTAEISANNSTSYSPTYTKVNDVATVTAEISTNNSTSYTTRYTKVNDVATVTAEISTNNSTSYSPTYTKVSDVATVTAEIATNNPASDHPTYAKVTNVATATAELSTNTSTSDQPTYTKLSDVATITAETATDSPVSDHSKTTEVTNIATATAGISTNNPESDHTTNTKATNVATATAGSSATSVSTFPTITSSTAADTPSLTTTASATGPQPPPVPTGAISVQCRGAAITVSVARDFLQRASIRENALYLGLPGCGVNGDNATHVQLTVGWTECDTRLVHNESHYMASVTLFNTVDQSVPPSGDTPKLHLEVPVTCAYVKSMLLSADFSSMGYQMFKDVVVGSGSFLVRVRLMNGTAPLPHNYSLSPDEVVVVDVSLNTTLDQIKVVMNKCWATPTRDPGDAFSYVFLENSCSLNTYTKVLSNGNASTSRVSVQIFSFVDLSVIYLHCQVHICAQVGSDSCVPDCFQRTSRASGYTVATALGSSGPLLKSDQEDLEDDPSALQVIGLSCLGIGLCIFFIIALVFLFYCQRNRIGHYNFSANPKQENFTSLESSP